MGSHPQPQHPGDRGTVMEIHLGQRPPLTIRAPSHCPVFPVCFRLQPVSRLSLTTGIFKQEFGSKREFCKILTHVHRKQLLSILHTLSCTSLISLISSVCVTTEPPSTGWPWPSSCLPCGTASIQAIILHSSPPSPSPWQHEQWVPYPPSGKQKEKYFLQMKFS